MSDQLTHVPKKWKHENPSKPYSQLDNLIYKIIPSRVTKQIHTTLNSVRILTILISVLNYSKIKFDTIHNITLIDSRL